MQLFFIRHGQSTNNVIFNQTGTYDDRSEDPELSPAGVRQTEYLAEWFGSAKNSSNEIPLTDRGAAGSDAVEASPENPWGITAIFSSPMLRAASTAYPVSIKIGVPLQVWTDLHEAGGIYLDDPVTGEPVGLPGNSRSYLAQRFPGAILPEDLPETGWWNHPQETGEELQARGQRVVRQLKSCNFGLHDRIMFFSHGDFYNQFLWALFGYDRKECYWFNLNNTGITRIDIVDGQADIVYTNKLNHLPLEWIT
jgi:2,3-bisphosphoglycerate-dependent phosphoglycerate mutase